MPESPWKTAGELGTVGLSFVIAIALGTGLGWWVDRTFGTNPWGFFVFFAFGVAAGVLNVYRTMGRVLRDESRRSRGDPRP